MKLPDFIIAGFGKCGTTSLRAVLRQHPQVQTYNREIGFFSLNKRWRKGMNWYKRHFFGPCAGEKTPYYVYSRNSMRRMARNVPDVRLIFCVRNPVDRLFSWYHHKVIKDGYATEQDLPFSAYRSFHQVARFDPLPTGFYAKCIRENVLPYFPLDRCLFIVQERMSKDTEAEGQRTLEFLGLPPHPVVRESRNVSRYRSVMPADVRAELLEYYRPHNAEFYELTGLSIPEWDR